MYEGLQEGLRAATKIEMLSWVSDETQEVIQTIERKGEKLWMQATTRVMLIEPRAIDYIQDQHFKEANRIVDQILGNVNWDHFFPTPILPDGSVVARPMADVIKRDGRYGWL